MCLVPTSVPWPAPCPSKGRSKAQPLIYVLPYLQSPTESCDLLGDIQTCIKKSMGEKTRRSRSKAISGSLSLGQGGKAMSLGRKGTVSRAALYNQQYPDPAQPFPAYRCQGAAMGGSDGGDPAVPAVPTQQPDAPGGPERVWSHLLPPDATRPTAYPECELGFERNILGWGSWSTQLHWRCPILSALSTERLSRNPLLLLLGQPVPGTLRAVEEAGTPLSSLRCNL